MKRTFILALSLLLLLSVPVSAHPDKSDIIEHYGRVSDSISGSCDHYHHGYPAHFHFDTDGDGTLECPYDPGKPFVVRGSGPLTPPSTSDSTPNSTASPVQTSVDSPDTAAASSFDEVITIIVLGISAIILIFMVIYLVPFFREIKSYKIDRSPEAAELRHRRLHLFLRWCAVRLPCLLAATVVTSMFTHAFHPEEIFGNTDGALFFGGSVMSIFVALCYGFFVFWLPNHIWVDWQHTVPPRKERRSSTAPENPSHSSDTDTPQTSSDLILTKEERSMLLKFRLLNPNDQAAIRSTIEQAYTDLIDNLFT